MSRVSESSGSKEQMNPKLVGQGSPRGCSSLLSLISGDRSNINGGAIGFRGAFWCSPLPQDKFLEIRECHEDGRQLDPLHVCSAPWPHRREGNALNNNTTIS
ncbi:hypothetical protein N9L68_09275, partial [bacterium]|nr:hypothetical protein [bacterium]